MNVMEYLQNMGMSDLNYLVTEFVQLYETFLVAFTHDHLQHILKTTRILSLYFKGHVLRWPFIHGQN